jgi:hypothetical protein
MTAALIHSLFPATAGCPSLGLRLVRASSDRVCAPR